MQEAYYRRDRNGKAAVMRSWVEKANQLNQPNQTKAESSRSGLWNRLRLYSQAFLNTLIVENMCYKQLLFLLIVLSSIRNT